MSPALPALLVLFGAAFVASGPGAQARALLRARGTVAIPGAGALFLLLWGLPELALGTVALPILSRQLARLQQRKRLRRSFENGWPRLLDELAIRCAVGMPLNAALGDWMAADLAHETEMQGLQAALRPHLEQNSIPEVLHEIATYWNAHEHLDPFLAGLGTAWQSGVPLTALLTNEANRFREQLTEQAEVAAQQLQLWMLPPLILVFLALVLAIAGPLVLELAGTLS